MTGFLLRRKRKRTGQYGRSQGGGGGVVQYLHGDGGPQEGEVPRLGG